MTANQGRSPLYRGTIGAFSLVFFLSLLYLSLAVPSGPENIVVSTPTTRNANAEPATVEAQAGNLTELFINATRQTSSWQGYFGQITGTVVLQDADNATFYDWTATTFEGEIYATNQTVNDWANVECVNLSGDADTVFMNETSLETAFGISSTAGDGFSETFDSTYTNTTGFQVGAITINNADACHLAHTFVNSLAQTVNYEEVLLHDDHTLIFTTLIYDGVTGYNGSLWDFQMLVAEDGSVSGSTTYYFYAEIN